MERYPLKNCALLWLFVANGQCYSFYSLQSLCKATHDCVEVPTMVKGPLNQGINLYTGLHSLSGGYWAIWDGVLSV